MNQRGITHLFVFGLVVVVGMIIGAYFLGQSSTKQIPVPTENPTLDSSSPTVSTISTPTDVNNWVIYKIKTLNLEFKLPANLANKYGKIIEHEISGERGSELKITFTNNSKNLVITAQSPEFTPIPPTPAKLTEEQATDLAIGGPGISIPSVFQGFMYKDELYYGIQPFGQMRALPKEQVTQYHTNGRDILKVKALYGDYGMVQHTIFPENPPKIWGIISGTGNRIYPGFTIEGVVDTELTEPVFEQILSTFASINY